MEITPTSISGVYVVRLAARGDARGYFMRTYDRAIFAARGLQTEWVQENQSMSVLPGTVRGLHFQTGAAAETKLVRVLAGKVFDVAVDLRKGSPTYGQHVGAELSAANNSALYIPRGCAHGFCSMEPESVVCYKVDNYYAPESEGGLLWCDPALGIPWPLQGEPSCISEKDSKWPALDGVAPVEPVPA